MRSDLSVIVFGVGRKCKMPTQNNLRLWERLPLLRKEKWFVGYTKLKELSFLTILLDLIGVGCR